jgi:hypothetical protein
MNITDEHEIAEMDRADLIRTDKAARFVCTECGGRGWHFTGCPEDVEDDSDETP